MEKGLVTPSEGLSTGKLVLCPCEDQEDFITLFGIHSQTVLSKWSGLWERQEMGVIPERLNEARAKRH